MAEASASEQPPGDVRNRVRGVNLSEVKWAQWLNVYDFDLITNFRDCAGTDPMSQLNCTGGKLKRGQLYRCGAWTTATEADIKKLRDTIGIRTYIDLRNSTIFGVNLEGAPGAVFDVYAPSPWPLDKTYNDRPAPGEFRRVHVNLYSDLQPRKLDMHEAWNYEQIFLTHVEAAMESSVSHGKILQVMDLLADERNYPVAFGCTAGKDRTGLIAVLVQKLLGVEDKNIIEEYMNSNLSNGHLALCWHAARVQTFKRLQNDHGDLLKDVLLERSKIEGISESAVDKLLVDLAKPASSIEQINSMSYLHAQTGLVYLSNVLLILRKLHEHGGIAKYLSDLGFGEDKQRKLRQILIEPSGVLVPAGGYS